MQYLRHPGCLIYRTDSLSSLLVFLETKTGQSYIGTENIQYMISSKAEAFRGYVNLEIASVRVCVCKRLQVKKKQQKKDNVYLVSHMLSVRLNIMFLRHERLHSANFLLNIFLSASIRLRQIRLKYFASCSLQTLFSINFIKCVLIFAYVTLSLHGLRRPGDL